MTTVSRVQFRSYAGPRIKGTESFEIEEPTFHWDRVLWLTSKVESGGRFGAITMYDGTACTAGLHQAIAVYPQRLRHEDFAAENDQGSLWSMLRMLEMVPDLPPREELWAAFAERNWYVATDGRLRYLSDATVKVKSRNRKVKAGDLVYGFDIRETLTPNEGAVPARGAQWEQSRAWALRFHAVFSDSRSFQAQVKFGQEHYHRYCEKKKITVGPVKKTVGEWLYDGRHMTPNIDNEALDLALAVLWSHSVNGPARAWAFLKAALAKHTVSEPEAFAKDLLGRLGRSTYGRWHHSEKNGRWARTRLTARRSGYWPSELFKDGGVMPKNL